MEKVRRTEQEWRERLTPQEYHVLREAGTEAPFTGEYTDTRTEGVYRCRACGAELFRSDAKFESHCGWPSFYKPADSDAVVLLEDRSLGRVRTEVRCAACDSHLGHVFEGEGYDVPTDQRWCINSISLTLEPCRASCGAYGSAASRSSTGFRLPVKNGISARVCSRALAPRRWRIRSVIRCSSSASKARIHS